MKRKAGRPVSDKPKPPCLYPTCERESKARGLCHSHYQTALRLVKEGLSTWDRLEELGRLCLPRGQRRLPGGA